MRRAECASPLSPSTLPSLFLFDFLFLSTLFYSHVFLSWLDNATFSTTTEPPLSRTSLASMANWLPSWMRWLACTPGTKNFWPQMDKASLPFNFLFFLFFFTSCKQFISVLPVLYLKNKPCTYKISWRKEKISVDYLPRIEFVKYF